MSPLGLGTGALPGQSGADLLRDSGYGQEGPLKDAPASRPDHPGPVGRHEHQPATRAAHFASVIDRRHDRRNHRCLLRGEVRWSVAAPPAEARSSTFRCSIARSRRWVGSCLQLLIAGHDAGPDENDNFTAAPLGTFKTGDGLLNIAANKQEQFRRSRRLSARAGSPTDPRFADRESRKNIATALTAELEAALRHKSAAVETMLNRLGIPPAGRNGPGSVEQSPSRATRDCPLVRFLDVPGVNRPLHADARRLQIVGGRSPRVLAASAWASTPTRFSARSGTRNRKLRRCVVQRPSRWTP